MRDAAIAHIHLGRFYQPLADIAVPSRQSPNEQKVNKKIKITGDRLAIDTQATRQIGSIKNLSLVVCQHRPETPEGPGRYARTKLRNVALHIGSDEVAPPIYAEIAGLSQETARKATPNPERLDRSGIDLQARRTGQVPDMKYDPQGFRRFA